MARCREHGTEYVEAILVALSAGMLGACAGVGETAVSDAPILTGSRWLAEDIKGSGVIDYAQSSLEFLPGGGVAGSGACNGFSGTFEIAHEAITIGALASTKRVCPEAVARQEQAFIVALERAARWHYTNRQAVAVGPGRCLPGPAIVSWRPGVVSNRILPA